MNKKSSRLAVGISGGADILSYDFTQLNVNDPNDPYLASTYQTTKPNLGAGIYYYSDKHYVSLSSPRLIEASTTAGIVDTLAQKFNTRHFFLSGGYMFDLNSVIKLQPSLMTKYTPGAPLTVDVNMFVILYDQIWLGALYRYHEAVAANVMYNYKNTLSIGYNYDFPINGLRTYQYGSHEIFLRYDFVRNKKSFTSPRYF